MDSPKLVAIVESRFPTPVAKAFADLRRQEQDSRDSQYLIGLLEAIVQYLGSVVACGVAAVSSHDPARFASFWAWVRRPEGLDNFCRPLSAGSWEQLISKGVAVLEASGDEMPLSGLETWLRTDGRRLLADAVQERNKIHDGSATYSKLKQHLIQLLNSLAELPAGTYLAAVETLTLSDGLRRADLRLFEGVAPSRCTLELSGEVETGRVYLLTPAKQTLLSLHPFLSCSPCSECGLTHLFRLRYVDKQGFGRYAAVEAEHQQSREDAKRFIDDLPTSVSSVRCYSLEHLALPWGSVSQLWGAALQPGERVAGRYTVEALIGHGGMGQVYAAMDNENGTRVALKILPFYLWRDSTLLQRFRAEIGHAARMSHPGITRVLDHGESLQEHYLALELAPGWVLPDSGGPAADLSRVPKPVPLSQAISVVSQLCEALSYLHAHGIIHRDVKPQNVLLFPKDVVKLTDFGIAQSRESVALTMTGQMLGTPEYIAPEQAEGSPVDLRADIYSLGVLFYELLSGEVPFRGATPLSTALMHKDPDKRMPELPDSVPAPVAAIVAKALQKRASDRFQSAIEFLDALRLWESEGRGPEVVPQAASEPLVAHRAAQSDAMAQSAPEQQRRVPLTASQKVGRWAAFLPLAFLSIAMTQVASAIMVESLPTWVALGLLSMLSLPFTMASAMPCRMTPDPKVAATIVLTVFVLAEGFALSTPGARQSPAFSQLARLWTDLAIVAGALWAARTHS